MAFDQSGFAPMGGENTNTPTLWGYTTTDSLATVSASGYFNNKVFQIEAGDFLFVVSGNDRAIGYFGNDGTNVTTVIIEGSEGIETPWPAFTEVNTDTTITATVQCLAVDASGGDVTITLPALGNGNYIVKKVDSSANSVIITGGVNIDGQATQSIVSQYNSLMIINRSTEWAIV